MEATNIIAAAMSATNGFIWHSFEVLSVPADSMWIASASCSDAQQGSADECEPRGADARPALWTIGSAISPRMPHASSEGAASTHEQTSFHSYRPVRSLSTCFCTHRVVPSGGSRGVGMGAIDGGTIGQMRGEHIGSISNVLEHTALTSPFIQTHWHPAFASPANDRSPAPRKIAR